MTKTTWNVNVVDLSQIFHSKTKNIFLELGLPDLFQNPTRCRYITSSIAGTEKNSI